MCDVIQSEIMFNILRSLVSLSEVICIVYLPRHDIRNIRDIFFSF